MSSSPQKLRIGIVVGEASGDILGADLICALKQVAPEIGFEFFGLAGNKMQALGMKSLFDIEDISVMGISAVIPKIPMILKRIKLTVNYLSQQSLDALITIDSPDFTQRVAKKFHKKCPKIPIIGYVSPSVWAWRSGRAKVMARYMNHLMALLPFEPDAHKALGGPACTYVGHPLIEKVSADNLERIKMKKHLSANLPRSLVLLPGSRRTEIEPHMPLIRSVLEVLDPQLLENTHLLLPTLPKHKDRIQNHIQEWPWPVKLSITDQEKWQAFEQADAALAASGTVTLELGVMGVPTIAIYQLSWLDASLRFLVRHLPSFILTNLVLGKNVYPEYIDKNPNIKAISGSLSDLLTPSKARNEQINGLLEFSQIMNNEEISGAPSTRAARVVLNVIKKNKENASS